MTARLLKRNRLYYIKNDSKIYVYMYIGRGTVGCDSYLFRPMFFVDTSGTDFSTTDRTRLKYFSLLKFDTKRFCVRALSLTKDEVKKYVVHETESKIRTLYNSNKTSKLCMDYAVWCVSKCQPCDYQTLLYYLEIEKSPGKNLDDFLKYIATKKQEIVRF